MSSYIIIKRRFVGENNEDKPKQNFMITSTPLKSKTVHQSEMEWPSPVEKSSNEIPNPQVLMNSIQIKTNEQKSAEDYKNLDKKDKAYESVDKICLINHFSGPNTIQEPPAANDIDVEPKNEELKQLIVMNSDEEEEFWRNRNKPIKKRREAKRNSNQLSTDSQPLSKKRRIQKEIESIDTMVTDEESGTIAVQNHGVILPKIIPDSSKAVPCSGQTVDKATPAVSLPSQKRKKDTSQKSGLKVSRNLRRNKSSENFNRETIVESMEQGLEKREKQNGNTVRRSNRKKSKPLEFWNGEKMEIDEDFTCEMIPVVKYSKKNSRTREAKKVQVSEIESESGELKQSNQISGDIKNLENNHKPERSITPNSETNKRKKSNLKSQINTKSKANVRFSAIGTGTTIDGLTSNRNIKPDWMINFPGIHSNKKLLPDSENCVVLPGLNTAMGIISSAVIYMRPKAINHSKASDLHHLVFCVMVGTVTVTIDEISVQMKTYGHFTVPCGVLYSIENIGKQKAILSFFKVACNCISK